MVEVAGAARVCGQQYGEAQREGIDAFLHMAVAPDPKRLRYAARCWEVLKDWEPAVVDFVRGMAEGAGLTRAEATLLILHEEVEHLKHCTAVGATGAATRDGKPIIGQNWDWLSHLYAWSHLTRVAVRGQPKVLAYSFPGLWTGAGINEHGMSFVWTTGGAWPTVRPRVGIPSYALIAAILARKTCAEAIAMLRRTKNAGAFLFMIADATGEVWVVEGFPHTIEAVRCRDVLVRATYYETERMRRLSKQDVAGKIMNTKYRGARMERMARAAIGNIDGPAVQRFLRDETNHTRHSICCRPKGDFRWATLDSFYCLPEKREFWIARGQPDRHVFKKYTA